MKVQVNTDNHIKGTQRLNAYLDEKLNAALQRFSDRLTRVEVHLSDQNGEKKGKDDIQCRIEARANGLQPITVTSKGENMDIAINSAVDKIKSALDTVFGKLKSKV